MRFPSNEITPKKERKEMINDNIRKARKASGITQKELAAALGVYQKDISRWENGERLPSLEIFAKICRVLNVSADFILEIEIGEEQRKGGRLEPAAQEQSN